MHQVLLEMADNAALSVLNLANSAFLTLEKLPDFNHLGSFSNSDSVRSVSAGHSKENGSVVIFKIFNLEELLGKRFLERGSEVLESRNFISKLVIWSSNTLLDDFGDFSILINCFNPKVFV
jgi:hypothetical protein